MGTNTHLMGKKMFWLWASRREMSILVIVTLYFVFIRQRNLNSQLPSYFLCLPGVFHSSSVFNNLLYSKVAHVSLQNFISLNCPNSDSYISIPTICILALLQRWFKFSRSLKITRTHLNVGYLKNNDTTYNP